MTQVAETTSPTNLQLACSLLNELKQLVQIRYVQHAAAHRLITDNIAHGVKRTYGKRKLCLTIENLARHGEALMERRRCQHELMYLVPLKRFLQKELNRGVHFEDRESLEALAYRLTPKANGRLNIAGDIAKELVQRYAPLMVDHTPPGRMPRGSRLDLMEEPHLSRRKRALYAKLTEAVCLTAEEDSLLRGALQLAPTSSAAHSGYPR